MAAKDSGPALPGRAARRQHHRHREPDGACDDQRRAPAPHGGHGGGEQRRGREADGPADDMHREGPAEPLGPDAMAEDGEVGGVVDAVADAGETGQRQQPEIGRGEAHRQHRACLHHDAADEQPVRAEAIHEHAGRDLPEARAGVEHGEDQPQLDEADSEVVAHHRQQRRGDELQQVAGEMGKPHRPHHAQVSGRRPDDRRLDARAQMLLRPPNQPAHRDSGGRAPRQPSRGGSGLPARHGRVRPGRPACIVPRAMRAPGRASASPIYRPSRSMTVLITRRGRRRRFERRAMASPPAAGGALTTILRPSRRPLRGFLRMRTVRDRTWGPGGEMGGVGPSGRGSGPGSNAHAHESPRRRSSS